MDDAAGDEARQAAERAERAAETAREAATEAERAARHARDAASDMMGNVDRGGEGEDEGPL